MNWKALLLTLGIATQGHTQELLYFPTKEHTPAIKQLLRHQDPFIRFNLPIGINTDNVPSLESQIQEDMQYLDDLVEAQLFTTGDDVTILPSDSSYVVLHVNDIVEGATIYINTEHPNTRFLLKSLFFNPISQEESAEVEALNLYTRLPQHYTWLPALQDFAPQPGNLWGIIVETHGGEPVTAALLHSSLGDSSFSDSLGRYQIPAYGDTLFQLRIEKQGYVPRQINIHPDSLLQDIPIDIVNVAEVDTAFYYDVFRPHGHLPLVGLMIPDIREPTWPKWIGPGFKSAEVDSIVSVFNHWVSLNTDGWVTPQDTIYVADTTYTPIHDNVIIVPNETIPQGKVLDIVRVFSDDNFGNFQYSDINKLRGGGAYLESGNSNFYFMFGILTELHDVYLGPENEGGGTPGNVVISIFNPAPTTNQPTQNDINSFLWCYRRNIGDQNFDQARLGMDTNGINYKHDVSDVIYNSKSNDLLDKLR